MAKLTDGQKSLINYVKLNTIQTIIVLGDPAIRNSDHDPLTVEMRRRMIEDEYPDILILSLRDTREDLEWSEQLDKLISREVPSDTNVILYGGRNSFIPHYQGKYPTVVANTVPSESGSEQRTKISINVTKSSRDFREGVIWSTNNKYPSIIPTVDIAPIVTVNNERCVVLIGKHEDGGLLRFVGGHVDMNISNDLPNYILQRNAIKECKKETGLHYYGDLDNVKCLGSSRISDWRYPGKDRILTTFFVAEYYKLIRKLKASDDADVIKTFPIETFLSDYPELLVPEHIFLGRLLSDYLNIYF